ncbi:hypothetical protein B0H17DRAFT_1099734 [Mycena rosella]|uniref:Uncharacterized protein n=1 Tax=Mycena rosella TaxID=1033263 RepID=A0AAD7CNG7_MYCRO|nr:hypothetical protein B0H17DRAFT_1099734 [Mycena rosella]
MLARLSAAASQVEFSAPGDEHFFFDMDTFRLVLPVPDITWGCVAQMCERAMNPMYKGLYSILEQDMEHVAQVLAALESDSERVDHYMVPCDVPHNGPSTAPSNGVPKPESNDPLVIRSSHPSVPTIVITPCPRPPRETSCQVPYQDSAFGNQLSVPSLPSFNQSFPPMMPPRRVSARGINHWIWTNGHWQAALGALEPRPRVLKHRKKAKGRAITSK